MRSDHAEGLPEQPSLQESCGQSLSRVPRGVFGSFGLRRGRAASPRLVMVLAEKALADS